MPFADKITFRINRPIVLNTNYIRSATGVIKCLQCLFGLGSVLFIWYSCRQNYDPYLGTYDGFIGGDLETSFLLLHFTFFQLSLFIVTTYYFSIIASTIIPKTIFELAYNVLATILLGLTSLSLLIGVTNRNHNDDSEFPPEPGFGGKVTASIFGLLNAFLFGADIFFSYRAYIQS